MSEVQLTTKQRNLVRAAAYPVAVLLLPVLLVLAFVFLCVVLCLAVLRLGRQP